MRTACKSIALLGCAVVLMCCVTHVDRVSVQTNKDPSFDEPLQRIYVVVDTLGTSIEGASLDDYLCQEIEERFSLIGVKTKAAVPSGLELNEDEIEEGRKNFRARFTMSIRREGEKVDVRTGGYMSPSGFWMPTTSTEVTYFFDVTISDASRNAKVWRSKLSVKGEFKSDSVDELIDDLIVALHGDGLLAFQEDGFQPVASHKEVNVQLTMLLLGLLACIPLFFLLY